MKDLHSVLLFVEDLEASVAFYRDRLEFTVDYIAPGQIALIRFGAGQVILHPAKEMEGDFLPPFGSRGRGVIVNFSTDEVDAYYARLSGREVNLTRPLRDQIWGDRDFYLLDPDGYSLCFAQKIVSNSSKW